MTAEGSAGPVASGLEVQAWYLHAVIRVYEPWTRSRTVSARERALAARRVRYAGQTLADLTAQLPRGASGAWETQP